MTPEEIEESVRRGCEQAKRGEFSDNPPDIGESDTPLIVKLLKNNDINPDSKMPNGQTAFEYLDGYVRFAVDAILDCEQEE